MNENESKVCFPLRVNEIYFSCSAHCECVSLWCQKLFPIKKKQKTNQNKKQTKTKKKKNSKMCNQQIVFPDVINGLVALS